MAVVQSQMYWLIHRHRGQAPSHIDLISHWNCSGFQIALLVRGIQSMVRSTTVLAISSKCHTA
jgi:hypothetical protein